MRTKPSAAIMQTRRELAAQSERQVEVTILVEEWPDPTRGCSRPGPYTRAALVDLADPTPYGVWVWDHVSESYTSVHSLTGEQMELARQEARGERPYARRAASMPEVRNALAELVGLTRGGRLAQDAWDRVGFALPAETQRNYSVADLVTVALTMDSTGRYQWRTET